MSVSELVTTIKALSAEDRLQLLEELNRPEPEPECTCACNCKNLKAELDALKAQMSNCCTKVIQIDECSMEPEECPFNFGKIIQYLLIFVFVFVFFSSLKRSASAPVPFPI